MPSLVTVEGSAYELPEGGCLIGRGERGPNDPPKLDVTPFAGGRTVSRQHARVYPVAGAWYLRVEPEARNATWVAGRLLRPGDVATVSDGMSIRLGELELTFRNPEAGGLPAEVREGEAAPATGTAQRNGQEAAIPVAWAPRVPFRAAAVATLGRQQPKRINPFRGLMVDEQIWADAHDYHRVQARLHLLSGHGWGVVEGLEVVADPRSPGALVVRPGLAIDPEGYVLALAEERRVPAPALTGQTVYVVLRARDELAEPQHAWSDHDEYTRVIETCLITVETAPPVPPALELARVQGNGPLRNPADPRYPQQNELDHRFREQVAVRPRPDIIVAQAIADERDLDDERVQRHQAGLRQMLREVGLTAPYRARWTGVVRLDQPMPPCSLLYLACTGPLAFSEPALAHLRAFFADGGVLLVDSCTAGDRDGVRVSAGELASRLGRRPQRVLRGHPLLSARHLFALPPLPGPQEAVLTEDDGLVISTADYGCAWQGGPPDDPLGREAIRAALEFGVNAAVYALQRQRPLEAILFEP